MKRILSVILAFVLCVEAGISVNADTIKNQEDGSTCISSAEDEIETQKTESDAAETEPEADEETAVSDNEKAVVEENTQECAETVEESTQEGVETVEESTAESTIDVSENENEGAEQQILYTCEKCNTQYVVVYYLLEDGIAITKIGLPGTESEQNTECFEVPSEIDGFEVTTIEGQALEDTAFVSEITIPQCVISIGKDALGTGITVIRGYKGSAAEVFADENSIEFVDISDSSGASETADESSEIIDSELSVSSMTSEVENTALYAAKTVTKYKITYYLNGGTNAKSNPSVYCKSSKKITLASPVRKGYTFKGWYIDSGYKRKISVISAGSTGEKTFYAKWQANIYNIRFSGNGATKGKMPVLKNCRCGIYYTLPANTYKRPGYTFTGWNTRADGTEQAVSNKETLRNLSVINGRTITLYAIWKKTRYSITYYLNGGSNKKSNPSGYYISSGTIVLSSPTRKGYIFKGWYKDSKFKTKVTRIKSGSTGNRKLYAKWTPIKYSIRFNGNGASSGKMAKVTGCRYGTAYTLKANTYKRTHYTFVGWNTKADGTGTTYKNKASIKNLAVTNGKTVTLYAMWKINTYSICFVGNGSNSGRMNTVTGVKYGSSYTLPKNVFTKKKHLFVGWNTKADGTGKSYKNGVSVKNLTSVNGKTIMLYAQWKYISDETECSKHSYGEWVITKEAGDTAGSKYRICKLCGNKETVSFTSACCNCAGVSMLKQLRSYTCGPTSLAMVINYLAGTDYTGEEAFLWKALGVNAQTFMTTNPKGFLEVLSKYSQYIADLKYNVASDPTTLRNLLKKGYVIIMCTKPGGTCYDNSTTYRTTKGGHYYVLCGYDEDGDGIHVHDTGCTAFTDYNVSGANKVLSSNQGGKGAIIAVKKKE